MSPVGDIQAYSPPHTIPTEPVPRDIHAMNIALLHNWPNLRNSELDLIGRIRRVLSQLGHDSTIIDPFGNHLDSDGQLLPDTARIDATDFDFCINLHYTNPNFLDCFSYVINWNPYDYIVRDPSHQKLIPEHELSYLASCLRTHDIVLSADSDKTDQLVAALADRPDPGRYFPDLRLHTTCQLAPETGPVSLKDFRVFYIGINWERLANPSSSGKRHGGLLEMLDRTNRVEFYGVREMYGINPWEGFNNYKGELPFDDGQSIIRTANRCGVTLVLSSKAHRESSVVSTRLFQACAARTIIISDDNPFVTEQFGDAVLSFPYSPNPQRTFDHIAALMEWIETHPEEAKQKAERAHHIFASRFSLDQEIRYLVDNHEAQRSRIEEQTLPIDRLQTVDVLFNLDSGGIRDIDDFIGNLNHQQAVLIHATVCCPPEQRERIAEQLQSDAQFSHTVLSCDKVDNNSGKFLLQAVIDHGQGDSFCIYRSHENWSRHHLAYLLRTLQNGTTLVSQTHTAVNNDITAGNPYDRSLSSLAIDVELTCLRPDHLASRAVHKFSPAAFLFHKKLLINNLDSAQHVRLFHHAAWFYLLLLNYVTYQTLPASTNRLTLSFRRPDDLFTLIDLDDNALERLREEATILGQQFHNRETTRELATLAKTLRDTEADSLSGQLQQHGMYSYLIKTFRNRPGVLRIFLAVYNTTRFLLRLPPNPPKSA